MIFRNSGIFYEVFDNDSYIMHYLFSYKISNTGKVGFPISAKNKVINVLDSKKINYLFDNNIISYSKYFATISNYTFSYKASITKIRNYIDRNI